jgi:Rieske Fe-S protein
MPYSVSFHHDPNRRKFFVQIGGALGGLSLVGAVSSVLESCSSPVDALDTGAGSDAGKNITVDVSALTADDMAVHATAPSGRPLLVIRRSGSYECLLLVCTHQGCTFPDLDKRNAALTCVCHGSSFDLDGHVTGGPAGSNLTSFTTTSDTVAKTVTVKF